MSEIFDVASIVLLSGLLISRLFYVIFHFEPMYLNPLVFFLVPYYPGLSLIGGVVGALITLMIVTKRKKYPRGRFLDFFSFAFLAVLPIASLNILTSGRDHAVLFSILPIIYYGFLFIFFLKFLLPRFLQGQMRDGMMGFLILTNYALFSAVMVTLASMNDGTSLLTPELGILAILFIVSLILYLKQGLFVSLRR